jgi:putative PEP-CTERM system histidine kinase
MPWLGIAGYGVAAVAYGATAIILFISQPASRRASLLAVATTASSVWAGGIALLLLDPPPALGALVGLDALHAFVWTVCVLSWLAPPSAKRRLIVLSAIAGCWAPIVSSTLSPVPGIEWTAYPALLVMSLLGFLAVEQVFRNAKNDQRSSLRLLCLAAAGIFAIDLSVYSQATLLQGLVPLFWEARGVANAALVPLIVLAIKRQSEWESELFVSRQMVFYTASLLGVGIYLLTMGIVAYIIRALGGEWSFLLELLFLVAALAVLVTVLFSATIRGRFRVFLVKHFYRNKYDYRKEWLRLTQSLGRTGDLQLLAINALEGLARIVGSHQGDLWLAREPRGYEWLVSLDCRLAAGAFYRADHPIPTFLASKGWVIDSQEYAREPDRYGSCFGHPDEAMLPKDTVIVPLDCQGYLQGFAVLAKPAEWQSLNFEDHDILKTAGRQIAVVLAQTLTQEKLAETRQFEAMNKLSTFLMHDLKNVVAQQELVIANAQRFRHRPEFIDDAISTVRSGVERMKKVLEQLSRGTRSEPSHNRVDVSKILMEVRSQCADREPVPRIELNGSAVWVSMDRDKLTAALTHLVRNAQDATPRDGAIVIELERAADDLLITVVDTGKGMDQTFIRDRLFRPFDSTKGTKGMGIGAYQVRDMVRAAGGDVDVQSGAGVGTRFRVRLPIAAGGDDRLIWKQPAA